MNGKYLHVFVNKRKSCFAFVICVWNISWVSLDYVCTYEMKINMKDAMD